MRAADATRMKAVVNFMLKCWLAAIDETKDLLDEDNVEAVAECTDLVRWEQAAVTWLALERVPCAATAMLTHTVFDATTNTVTARVVGSAGMIRGAAATGMNVSTGWLGRIGSTRACSARERARVLAVQATVTTVLIRGRGRATTCTALLGQWVDAVAANARVSTDWVGTVTDQRAFTGLVRVACGA
jgi:uncharacterized alpha-E superfamily protein